jgi:septal ring factor EnvC (AmiA/AmiB activator)
MPKPKFVLVHPNPYHHIDHEGRPSAICPWDPVDHNPDRGFVGARIGHVVLEQYEPGDARGEMLQANHVVYDDEPVRLPASAYYLNAIRRGELIAADFATAKMANTNAIEDNFVEPSAALEAAKDAALGQLKILAHEEHDDDFTKPLLAHSFGPMKDAIERRKKAKEAIEKKAKDAADAAAKAAEAKKAAAKPAEAPKGGS